MKVKPTKKRGVFRLLCLIAYILCAIVLIVEASLNGKISSGQSNAVGGEIADIVNGIGGDQTTAVKPESIVIQNKTETAYVGDQYTLNVVVNPENTTYKSVNYSSTNEDVAVISSEGQITYLKEGTTTIQAVNEHYKSIIDSFEVNVYNVEATDISVSVNAENVDGIYSLDIHNNSYFVNCNVLPENTTFKNITYELDNNQYVSISNDGKITPLKYSKGEVTTITVRVNDLVEEIKVVVDMEIIKLESLSYTATNEIYPGQSVSPKVIYNPSDSSFKEYTLTSSDSSIVKISSKSYKGVKEGKATVTITSNEYKDIFVSFEVEVLPSPVLTDFTAKANSKLLIDAKGKISISGVKPKYAETTSIKYESLTPDILSVDSKGNYKGLQIGEGKIRIYSNDNNFKEKIITINVIERSANNDYTTDFDISYVKSKNVAFVSNETIDLKDYFVVSKFYYDNNIPTTDKEITYSVISNNQELVQGSQLKITKPGHYNVSITHNASHITKEVEIVVIDDFEMVANKNTLFVNGTLDFTLSFPENEHQDYVMRVDNESIATVHEEEEKYVIDGISEGTINLTILPIYDGVTYEGLSKTYSFDVVHKYADYIDLQLINDKNELINNNNIIYVDEKYKVQSLVDDTATIYNLSINSDNEDVLTIDNEGKIDIHGVGKAKITAFDSYSGKEKEIEVFVKNRVIVDSKNPVILKGEEAKIKDGEYSITNGYSAKIGLNFDSSSTYGKTTYKTSDDSVLSVGADGTLTPHAAGDVVITMICDDGNGERYEIAVNIRVNRQNLIKDLSAFFYKVRKGIGHFGAFLVLGIFSTFTYMLYLRKKKWLIAVPLNFVAGFALAGITEIIQLYVPGRYGSFNDVMIDFSGFLCSAILLTIIILLHFYIKHKKGKEIV